MHELADVIRSVRDLAFTVSYFGKSSFQVLEHRLLQRRSAPGPLTFVVGAPRSGTTFLAGALASRDMIDLGEVHILKKRIPKLVELPQDAAAREIRRTLNTVRMLGFARRTRAVEQTPETSFVLGSALRAFPDARAVHALRDGRDVVCSLLERGWLRAEHPGRDDAGQRYGSHPRFWVEPERREEFVRASEARRAAWAWRRYVEAVRAVGERVVELRYEELTTDPAGSARSVAQALGLDEAALAPAFAQAHSRSVGRWRRELTPAQLRDVEAEAGPLLAELGYLDGNGASPVTRLRSGVVVWLTGLPAAGKSTVSESLAAELRRRRVPVEIFDGDAMRRVTPALGFSRADRETNVLRIADAAVEGARGGAVALVAVIAPYAELRRRVRERVELEVPFVEVHVSTPLEECIRRDPKGLYARALQGELEHFTGVSDPYEEPAAPELRLDTSQGTPEDACGVVVRRLVELGHLPS